MKTICNILRNILKVSNFLSAAATVRMIRTRHIDPSLSLACILCPPVLRPAEEGAGVPGRPLRRNRPGSSRRQRTERLLHLGSNPATVCSVLTREWRPTARQEATAVRHNCRDCQAVAVGGGTGGAVTDRCRCRAAAVHRRSFPDRRRSCRLFLVTGRGGRPSVVDSSALHLDRCPRRAVTCAAVRPAPAASLHIDRRGTCCSGPGGLAHRAPSMLGGTY